MTAQKTLETIKKRLKRHNQGHLLAFWEELGPIQRGNLLGQIEQLDLPSMSDWIDKYVKTPGTGAFGGDFAPALSYKPKPSDPDEGQKYAAAAKLGRRLISDGKVAALVVAGGQGTRLGFDGPKGNFPVSPVRNKTLFQLFAESIRAASEKYHTTCPWYIMASPLNHNQIHEIFRENSFYGLGRDDVFIFQQGTLPNLSFDGKILLADKDRISTSPDGHGGSLKALYRSGALADMKSRGIELISYFQVDNPLVNIFDPLFVGLHVLDEAEMSSKAVLKTGPEEKVGVFCLVDGKVTVIEYSDLSTEQAQSKNADGSLVFGLGSIAIHIINTAFVERLNDGAFSLPLHRAVKKIQHIDRQGNLIEPVQPNGVKLESFVFDALPLALNSIILQTPREQEFAPVKNAAGADSVETARAMMVARAADWLESSGVSVPRRPGGSVDAVIEIAPSFALEKDDVKSRLGRIPKIKPADRIYLA